MTQTTITAPRMPTWLLITALLGAAWNVFGLFQLVSSINQTEDGLMMGGMSAQAAKAYCNLPLWMNLAFAVGAGGAWQRASCWSCAKQLRSRSRSLR